MLLLLVLSASASAASAADGKLIHLHFYFHEVDAGTPNATVVNVASLHKYVNAAPLSMAQRMHVSSTLSHHVRVQERLDVR